MFIYEVKYLFSGLINKDNDSDDDMYVDEDGEVIEAGSILEGNMYLGCSCIQDAFIEGEEMLEDMYEGEDYEIIAVNSLPINVMNWPGEGDPCQCPFCRAERMAYEDRMHFDCPNCGEKIEVADGGWEEIQCPKCQNEILRDRIIDIGNGKQKVLVI